MNTKKINIAIDGYSSCGKGTLAKMLANQLNYLFVDSGAMYRAFTLAMIQNKISAEDINGIKNLIQTTQITFEMDANRNNQTYLNKHLVESEIRSMEVSNFVSPVSKIAEVRDFLVKQQQAMGLQKGVVMDGRDIGTTVFPQAELKLFMVARPEIRAERRYSELKGKGLADLSFQAVLDNINERDRIDSTRENSPLKPAPDAIIIDNSELSKEAQFELALKLVKQVLNS